MIILSEHKHSPVKRADGRRTVDELRRVVHHALDLAVALEVADSHTGERATDLETLDEDRLGDELERRRLLQDAVVQRLVEGDGVLGLVLDLALGPLLLLCGLAAGRGGWCCLCFGLKNGKSARALEGKRHPGGKRAIHPHLQDRQTVKRRQSVR